MRPLAGDPLRRARSGRRLAGAKLKYTDMNSKYALPKDGGLIVDSAPSDIIRRYEKIPASVFEHESEGVGYVADLIVRAIKKHNEYSLSNEIFEDVQPFVLGLTTGRTPLGLYHELVRRYRDGMVSFSNVAVYSLDEFYPIGASTRSFSTISISCPKTSIFPTGRCPNRASRVTANPTTGRSTTSI